MAIALADRSPGWSARRLVGLLCVQRTPATLALRELADFLDEETLPD